MFLGSSWDYEDIEKVVQSTNITDTNITHFQQYNCNPILLSESIKIAQYIYESKYSHMHTVKQNMLVITQ